MYKKNIVTQADKYFNNIVTTVKRRPNRQST